MFASLVQISLGAILAENFVLMRSMGVSTAIGGARGGRPAAALSASTIFVMTFASALCWAADRWVMEPLGMEYMRLFAFVLIVLGIVQLMKLFLQKAAPALLPALCDQLPLVIINCAVLGVLLVNSERGYGFTEAVVNGFMGGVGFALALGLFRSVGERVQFSECPKSFEGLPISLVSAALIALAFMGFAGTV